LSTAAHSAGQAGPEPEHDSSLRLENMTPLFRIPDPKL